MATKQERAEALKKDWATNPRWKDVKRDYTAEEVINISVVLFKLNTLWQKMVLKNYGKNYTQMTGWLV
jgi:isocitrate lyase